MNKISDRPVELLEARAARKLLHRLETAYHHELDAAARSKNEVLVEECERNIQSLRRVVTILRTWEEAVECH